MLYEYDLTVPANTPVKSFSLREQLAGHTCVFDLSTVQ